LEENRIGSLYEESGIKTLTTTQIEVPRWTADELHQMVLGGKPQVAVFDCDGTLWSGDSGYGFMVWSLEQGLVSRSTTDWIDTRYRAYVAGQVSEEEICGAMLQIYAGLREHELRAAAADYVTQFVAGHEFAEIASLVAQLRQRGTELWAVSSTNRWVVAEGVRAFGIDEAHVLAAEVRVDDGLISSDLVAVPSGAGKAVALRKAGLPNPDAVFGNSIHDLAMLEMGRRAYPVNPSPALLKAAAKHGWGYFQPEGAKAADAAGGE
jgi:phosphoserine phosphatase